MTPHIQNAADVIATIGDRFVLFGQMYFAQSGLIPREADR
jgi:hypothetical protein